MRTGSQMVSKVNVPDLLLEIIFGYAENPFQFHKVIKQTPNSHLIFIHSSQSFNQITEVYGVKYGDIHAKNYIYYYCGKAVLKEKVSGLTFIACTKNEDENTIIIIS